MKWFHGYRMRLLLVGFVAAIAASGVRARADFTFGQPVNLGPTVNSKSNDLAAYVSADGLSLYFASNRPGGQGDYDIWVSTRETTEDGWGPPENLGPAVNASGEDFHPTVSSNGLELYFDSNRSGGLGGMDLWVSKRSTTDESWGPAENLGSGVNSTTLDKDAALSADGLELYFASSRDAGYPRMILYVTKRESKDAPWEVPVSLGPVVNDWDCQQGPSISSDGLVLVFNDYAYRCTPRPGGFGNSDLWLTMREAKDGDWGPPINLGPRINTASANLFGMISADGLTLYLNAGRPGAGDLWQAPILPIVDFDDDGSVGMNDLLALIGSWGTDDRQCDIGPIPWGDGVVDEVDLEVLMNRWGEKDYPVHIAVDDFESYTDDRAAGKTISHTWLNGAGYLEPAPGYPGNGTGSAVGHASGPPFAEQTIVHTGSQSMPLWYDNDGTILEGTEYEKTGLAFYSEAEREWDAPQDWTREGIELLTLWFHGDPGNAFEPLYVLVRDSIGRGKLVVHSDPAATTTDAWRKWSISLIGFEFELDLKAIQKMYIGVGHRGGTQPGGSGVLYVDDIELAPLYCCGDADHPYPAGDLNEDCSVDYADLALLCDHWLEDNNP